MKATALGPGPVVVEDGGGRQAVQLAGQLLLLLPMLLAAAAGLGQLDAAAELLSRRLQRGGAGGSYCFQPVRSRMLFKTTCYTVNYMIPEGCMRAKRGWRAIYGVARMLADEQDGRASRPVDVCVNASPRP